MYDRNVRTFYLFTFLRSFFLIGPIITLFYLEFVSYTQFGIIFAVGVLTALVFEMPSGVWADHLGRKRIVAIGTLLAAFELFLIAHGRSFGYFIAAGILGGLGSALVSGADTALVYDSLLASKREGESRRVYGRARAIRYFSIVIAALIGAPLYAYANTWPLYANSAIMGIAALFVLSMREPPLLERPAGLGEQWETLRRGAATVRSNPRLRWFVAFSVLSGLSIWLFHDLFRLPYYEAIGYPIVSLGVIVSLVSIIRSSVSWNAQRIEQQLGERRVVLLLLFAPPVLLGLMSLVRTPFALAFVVVLYCVWSLQEVVTEASLHERMGSNDRATVYSIHGFVNSLMLLVGSVALGSVADTFSVFVAIALAAGFALVSSLLLVRGSADAAAHRT